MNKESVSLVEIEKQKIGTEETWTVDARKLHEWLGVRKQFSDWARDQLKMFKKGQDYQIFTPGSEKTGKGRPRTEYVLTTDMAKSVALMSQTRKGKEVREYFIQAEKYLREIEAERAKQEWLKARAEGKIVRKEETDVIKAFVAYAEAQGSKNAQTYYQNITLGTYRALFLLEQGGQWKDLRSYLSPLQLNQLGVAENVAMKHIKEGMELGMHYRDVYAYAIGKVKEMAVLLGKQVPHSSGSVERLK